MMVLNTNSRVFHKSDDTATQEIVRNLIKERELRRNCIRANRDDASGYIKEQGVDVIKEGLVCLSLGMVFLHRFESDVLRLKVRHWAVPSGCVSVSGTNIANNRAYTLCFASRFIVKNDCQIKEAAAPGRTAADVPPSSEGHDLTFEF